jgi:predicted ester cyclase
MKGEAINMSEAEKALRRYWYEEVVNKGNIDLMDQVLGPGYLYHGPSDARIDGIDGLKGALRQVLAAFPDISATVKEIVAEGNIVATRLTISAHHNGPYMGIPPTGKPVGFELTNFARFISGKIVEDWDNYDLLAIFRQIGAFPLG